MKIPSIQLFKIGHAITSSLIRPETGKNLTIFLPLYHIFFDSSIPEGADFQNLCRKSFFLLTVPQKCGIIIRVLAILGITVCRNFYNFILGCRQAVRHQTLTLALVGSNPAIPARKKHTFVYQDNVCFFQRNLPLRASEIASL